MVLASIILALGLSFFIPSAGEASLQFALDKEIKAEWINEFDKYGSIELFSSQEKLEKRVMDIDDVAGIILNDKGEFKVILEGNESHDTKVFPRMIIQDILKEHSSNTQYIISDIGVEKSPVATYGAISLMLTSILIGGMVIGFNIIEEKEYRTLSALSVSPISRMQFLIGRSIIGFIIPLVHVYIMLWIFGFFDVDKLQVFVVTIISSVTGIFIGFVIGGISSNQLAGIANMKVIFFIISIAIVGSIMLPQEKEIFLYWAPPYWVFVAYEQILAKSFSWLQLFYQMGFMLMLIIGFSFTIRRKLRLL